MLGLYVGCLILGGVFVTLSILSGFGDADADFEIDADMDADFDLDVDADVDADFDADVDADVDVDADADAQGEVDVVTMSRPRYRPWLSFRFYTYALAFFGLTGLFMTWMGRGEELFGISMSALMGLFAGLSASYLVYYTNRDSAAARPAGERDFLGAQAEVLLPIQKGERGRVRVRLHGRTVDMRAETEDEDVVLDLGDPCFVLDIEDGIAKVIDMKALEAERRE